MVKKCLSKKRQLVVTFLFPLLGPYTAQILGLFFVHNIFLYLPVLTPSFCPIPTPVPTPVLFLAAAAASCCSWPSPAPLAAVGQVLAVVGLHQLPLAAHDV